MLETLYLFSKHCKLRHNIKLSMSQEKYVINFNANSSSMNIRYTLQTLHLQDVLIFARTFLEFANYKILSDSERKNKDAIHFTFLVLTVINHDVPY